MDELSSETGATPAAAAADIPAPEELIARARALVPVLRERARDCEREGKVPDETIRDMTDAGLFNIAKPKRYGGYEMGWDVFNEITLEISSGCGSSGWIFAVVGLHPLLANRFGIAVMDDIWGANPDALMSSSKSLSGTIKKVEGGYVGSGISTFSSGCLNSEWVLVGGAPVEGEDYSIGAMMPMSDVKILDTWDVVGLAGTGSRDIEFKDVFVPEHRTRGPGHKPWGGIVDAPIYRITAPGGPFSLSSVLLGIAIGALDQFLEQMKSRSSRFGAQVAAFQSMQMRVGESAAEIDAAKAVMRTHMKSIMKHLEKAPPPTGAGGFQAAAQGGPMSEPAAYAMLGNAYVAQLAYSAVDRLFYAAAPPNSPTTASCKDVSGIFWRAAGSSASIGISPAPAAAALLGVDAKPRPGG